MTGIEIPDTNEGISLRVVLEGKQQTIPDSLYGVYAGATKPGIRCVKRGAWKLIKYDVLGGAVRETQLFNLDENPHGLLKQHHVETVTALTGHRPMPHQRNLAEDPRYADKLDEMEALLLSEQQRLDDPHALWNQPRPD